MSHSIVTLQLGNYSNFIGSHFWNLHEYAFEDIDNKSVELDHDVNYYEGFSGSSKTVTFTPRMVSWDWKQNTGTRIVDDIYEEMVNFDDPAPQTRKNIKSLLVPTFNGNVEVFSEFTEEELKFNNDNDVIIQKDYKEWNQFTYSRYHPNSMFRLPKLFRNMDSTNFQLFSQGQDLMDSPEIAGEFENQTRFFAEKCDYLQGFQLLADAQDGFSGVSVGALSHLEDEYGKDVASFPVTPKLDLDNIDQLLNLMVMLNSMNSQSVFWSPLSLHDALSSTKRSWGPHISYEASSKYHTSAILAIALKSLLLPCITKQSAGVSRCGYQLSDYASLLNGHVNRQASLAVALPLPCSRDLPLHLAKTMPDQLFSTLNPLQGALVASESLLGCISGGTSSSQLETYFNCHFTPQQNRFFSQSSSCSLRRPFPAIFNPHTVHPLSGAPLRELHNPKMLLEPLCPASVDLSSVLYTSDNEQPFLGIYDTVLDCIKRRRLSTQLLSVESDTLTDTAEKFRDMF